MHKSAMKTPFERGHDVQFRLLVTERDERTRCVRASTCSFCIKFGYGASPSSKRNRTSHAQIFQIPFRTDSYTRHHKSEHPEKRALTLSFNRDVDEIMIDNLLFDDEEDSIYSSRSRALSIFNEYNDAAQSPSVDVYYTKIDSVSRFKMVLGFMAKSISFLSAA
eukprot:IDg8943t1